MCKTILFTDIHLHVFLSSLVTTLLWAYPNDMGVLFPQVKLLNKLAAARILNPNVGSKVLTDLVEGLEEASVTVEIRLKIDQNHADLKGGYVPFQEKLYYQLSNTTQLSLKQFVIFAISS